MGLDEEMDSTSEGLEADAGEEVHPWAREMYEGGLSFNGNERSELFLGNGDGTFEPMTDLMGADSPLDGRAFVAADFDQDGDLDLFVHNIQRERHELYRNSFDSRGFLKIQLRDQGPGWEAIGAQVIVQRSEGSVAQVLARGSGFASCAPPELVFGLGAEPGGRVMVRWPDGESESFGELTSGGAYLLERGSSKAAVIEQGAVSLPDPWPEGLRVNVGSLVGELGVEDLQGRPVVLEPGAEAGGGELLLNFWASYCAPCISELDDLEALHNRPDTSVVAITVDPPGGEARARAALDRAGVTFAGYRVPGRENGSVGVLDTLVDLRKLPIPTTLVIDGEGRILEVHRGSLEGIEISEQD